MKTTLKGLLFVAVLLLAGGRAYAQPTSWSYVGNPGLTDGPANYVDMIIHDGYLYAAYSL